MAIDRDWRNELCRGSKVDPFRCLYRMPLTHNPVFPSRCCGTFAATLNHCSRVTEFFRFENRLHLMFADSSRQWDDFYVNNSDKTGIYRSNETRHFFLFFFSFYSAYKNIMRSMKSYFYIRCNCSRINLYNSRRDSPLQI